MSGYIEKLKKEKSLTVIFDKSDNHSLRSIPLLMKLGFKKYSYPATWRRIERTERFEFGYDYFLSSQATKDNLPNPLIVITTQDWENKYPLNSISLMINKALSKNSKIVIVCDTVNFKISGSHRPLNEEELVTEQPINYKDLYLEYSNQYEQNLRNTFPFPLLDSSNVFLQECALLMQLTKKIRCKTLVQFLAQVLNTPENPFWQFWSNIFRTRECYTIPVDTEESNLLNYISRRFELSDKFIKQFIHQIRIVPACYLDGDNPQIIKAIKSDKALILYQAMMKEYNLRNEHN